MHTENDDLRICSVNDKARIDLYAYMSESMIDSEYWFDDHYDFCK